MPFPIPDSEDPPIPEHRSEWMNESNSLIPGSDEPPGGPSEKNGGRAVAESIPDMGYGLACREQGGDKGRRMGVDVQWETRLTARVLVHLPRAPNVLNGLQVFWGQE